MMTRSKLNALSEHDPFSTMNGFPFASVDVFEDLLVNDIDPVGIVGSLSIF